MSVQPKIYDLVFTRYALYSPEILYQDRTKLKYPEDAEPLVEPPESVIRELLARPLGQWPAALRKTIERIHGDAVEALHVPNASPLFRAIAANLLVGVAALQASLARSDFPRAVDLMYTLARQHGEYCYLQYVRLLRGGQRDLTDRRIAHRKAMEARKRNSRQPTMDAWLGMKRIGWQKSKAAPALAARFRVTVRTIYRRLKGDPPKKIC
jgi:hypothetical protein